MAGMQLAAALKSYGLLNIEGEAAKRTLKVSQRGHRIVAGHPDTDKLLQKSALSPVMYLEVWEHFEAKLPADELIHHYLQWERGFNPKAIRTFIADLRDTIAFAKLDVGEISTNGGIGEQESQTASEATQDQPKLPSGGANMVTDTFTLDEGAVALQYPVSLSKTSYDDLKDWMELQLRKIERRIKTEPEPGDE